MKTIDADELADRLEREGVRLLNVLPAPSFEELHIPGSESVPLEVLEERAHEILDTDEEIVVHCSGPDCGLSPKAAEILTAQGFERVRDFEGGLVEWIRSGREVIRNGERATPGADGTG